MSPEERPEFDPLEFDEQPTDESAADDQGDMAGELPEMPTDDSVAENPSEEVLGEADDDLSSLMAGGGSVSQTSHLTFEEVAGQDEVVSGVGEEEVASTSGVGEFDEAAVDTQGTETLADESVYPGEEEEEEDWLKKPSIWKRIGETSPFTVFLGVSLVALLVAIFCLWMELRHYDFDIKAQEARQAVSMAPADYRGLPSTTPTA